jgi:hypothetical protein
LAVLSYSTTVPEVIIAQKGNDVAFIENVKTSLSGQSRNTLEWHVFDGNFTFIAISYF